MPLTKEGYGNYDKSIDPKTGYPAENCLGRKARSGVAPLGNRRGLRIVIHFQPGDSYG